jgi:hypothetical protein
MKTLHGVYLLWKLVVSRWFIEPFRPGKPTLSWGLMRKASKEETESKFQYQ